jgi:F0F1-type ATP synthase epsilon subunit
MSVLQRRITIMTDLIAQLRELDQLRERARESAAKSLPEIAADRPEEKKAHLE